MESIPGWRAQLSNEEFLEQLAVEGGVICAAGPGLAPADRRLYALRDTTATVESIPLIASSIMSKKIAEGTDALVLDVKIGSGAFIPDPDKGGRELARTMVGLGTAHGVRTTAILTAMDQPLGRSAGNALEVEESVEVLAGGGPADVIGVTLALAREMVHLAGLDIDPADALADGRAMDRWRAMVAAQGGDPDAPLPVATENDMVRADADGVLQRLDARAVGVAAWRLGAGRARKEDKVSATAGVISHAKVGDVVRAGDPLLELRTDESHRFASAREALADGWTIGPEPAEPLPLILDRITPD
jgi:thymidine phosphorylase